MNPFSYKNLEQRFSEPDFWDGFAWLLAHQNEIGPMLRKAILPAAYKAIYTPCEAREGLAKK